MDSSSLELLELAIESEESIYKSALRWAEEEGCPNSQVMLLLCSELMSKEKLINSMKAYRQAVIDGTLVNPEKGQRWKNNKNQNVYTVQGLGRHSEQMERTVSYVDSKGELWFRPLYLFIEKFTFLDDGGVEKC